MTLDDILPEAVRHIGDAVSFTLVCATLASWLPSIAAGLSIIWTALRIYDWIVTHRHS
jgi:hypothetical protein